MNPKDLMIYDWVMIKDYPMRSMSKKVREEHFVRSLVEFEPIPLTEEILKANGFHKLKIDFVLYPDDSDSEYFVNFCDGCFGIKIMESYIEINYVHELQHALRLCGLNDLADNFKI